MECLMEDFFRNKFVIWASTIVGLFLCSAVFMARNDVYYQFEYSQTENIENIETDTLLIECVVFNSKELTLEEAKTLSLKNKPKATRLSVVNECETNSLGSKVYPLTRLPA